MRVRGYTAQSSLYHGLPAQPPVQDTVADKNPERGGQRDIRAIGQAAGPFAATQGDQADTDRRANDGADHEREHDPVPAQERADGSHELDVAQTHGFARHHDFIGHDLEILDLFRIEGFLTDAESGG